MSSLTFVFKDDKDDGAGVEETPVTGVVMEVVLVDISDIVSDNRHKMTVLEEQMCRNRVEQTLHSCQHAIPIPKQSTKLQQQQSNNGNNNNNNYDDVKNNNHLELTMMMITKIKRYYWLSDKYLSLCSILFKSWVYYYYHYHFLNGEINFNNDTKSDFHTSTTTTNNNNDNKNRDLRIMILPCTEAKKPYIPSEIYHPNESSSTSSTQQTNDPYPFNISHQYPFIGLVYYKLQSSTTSLYFQLGLDIVSFDLPKSNHYGNHNDNSSSMDEFLQVYQSCFTSWEMERIKVNYTTTTTTTMDKKSMMFSLFRKLQQKTSNNNNTVEFLRCQESCLKEFYLRWSMKEAYTKAIGLGMGIPFDSFEIHLLNIDDTNNYHHYPNKNNDEDDNKEDDNTKFDDSGIWSYIMRKKMTTTTTTMMVDSTNNMNNNNNSQKRTYHAIRGIVKYIKNTNNDSQKIWNFFFTPLTSSFTEQQTYKGCACVCMGPEIKNNDERHQTSSPLLTMQTITFETLLNWHKQNHNTKN